MGAEWSDVDSACLWLEPVQVQHQENGASTLAPDLRANRKFEQSAGVTPLKAMQGSPGNKGLAPGGLGEPVYAACCRCRFSIAEISEIETGFPRTSFAPAFNAFCRVAPSVYPEQRTNGMF